MKRRIYQRNRTISPRHNIIPKSFRKFKAMPIKEERLFNPTLDLDVAQSQELSYKRLCKISST